MFFDPQRESCIRSTLKNKDALPLEVFSGQKFDERDFLWILNKKRVHASRSTIRDEEGLWEISKIEFSFDQDWGSLHDRESWWSSPSFRDTSDVLKDIKRQTVENCIFHASFETTRLSLRKSMWYGRRQEMVINIIIITCPVSGCCSCTATTLSRHQTTKAGNTK